ncbi:hypothetical protein B484DRAFT_399627 [Ochromonadaceae sp. CCMP2298]|nr:hypothetical protein B484DRAFT_399627 [Ochromonadaceae sp. CCMP2298]
MGKTTTGSGSREPLRGLSRNNDGKGGGGGQGAKSGAKKSASSSSKKQGGPPWQAAEGKNNSSGHSRKSQSAKSKLGEPVTITGSKRPAPHNWAKENYNPYEQEEEEEEELPHRYDTDGGSNLRDIFDDADNADNANHGNSGGYGGYGGYEENEENEENEGDEGNGNPRDWDLGDNGDVSGDGECSDDGECSYDGEYSDDGVEGGNVEGAPSSGPAPKGRALGARKWSPEENSHLLALVMEREAYSLHKGDGTVWADIAKVLAALMGGTVRSVKTVNTHWVQMKSASKSGIGQLDGAHTPTWGPADKGQTRVDKMNIYFSTLYSAMTEGDSKIFHSKAWWTPKLVRELHNYVRKQISAEGTQFGVDGIKETNKKNKRPNKMGQDGKNRTARMQELEAQDERDREDDQEDRRRMHQTMDKQSNAMDKQSTSMDTLVGVMGTIAATLTVPTAAAGNAENARLDALEAQARVTAQLLSTIQTLLENRLPPPPAHTPA